MIFTLIFFLALVISLVYCYFSRWQDDQCIDVKHGIPLGFSIVFFGISLIVLCIAYPKTLVTYGRFVAYEKAVKAEYEIAIDRTEQLMIDNPNESTHVSVGFLALPLLSHSTQVADRIKEKRALVEWYHDTYELYTLCRRRWFLRQYMAKPPEGLFR